jgi:hypothetical protein
MSREVVPPLPSPRLGRIATSKKTQHVLCHLKIGFNINGIGEEGVSQLAKNVSALKHFSGRKPAGTVEIRVTSCFERMYCGLPYL